MFIKLRHKPTGRKVVISEPHAIALLKRKQDDYEEIEYAPEPLPEVKEEVTEEVEAPKEEEAPKPVAKKKTAKKESS